MAVHRSSWSCPHGTMWLDSKTDAITFLLFNLASLSTKWNHAFSGSVITIHVFQLFMNTYLCLTRQNCTPLGSEQPCYHGDPEGQVEEHPWPPPGACRDHLPAAAGCEPDQPPVCLLAVQGFRVRDICGWTFKCIRFGKAFSGYKYWGCRLIVIFRFFFNKPNVQDGTGLDQIGLGLTKDSSRPSW